MNGPDARAVALPDATRLAVRRHAPERPPFGPAYRPGGAPGVLAVGVALSYKVVGAQITFEPGPDGRAARLILHQNSRDQMAERIE